jgi:hypothetical protein
VAGESGKARLFDWLDAIAKLVGAFAVVAVAVFANSLQTRVSGISIQSQREQAESQLRASMFTSLITPIIGTQKDGDAIPADREQLLSELLALNFYENFELKPLLQDASDRLLADAEAKHKAVPGGSDVREPLWSIARRIAERQKASISWEWASYRANKQNGSRLPALLMPWRTSAQSNAQGCEVYFLTIEPNPRRPDIIKAGSACEVSMAFKETVEMSSPDGNYSLRLVATEPDWKNQTVRISAQPFLSGQDIKPTDPTYSFTLSWFDLPLTDNTLLPDGNRFAAYLRTFYPELQTVRVAVMWFPNGYFTPRERPLNYNEVQELLGRKAQ